MANKLYDESAVSAIATAIRGKNGLATRYKIGDMAQAINDIVIPKGLLLGEGDYTFASTDENKFKTYALMSHPVPLQFVIQLWASQEAITAAKAAGMNNVAVIYRWFSKQMGKINNTDRVYTTQATYTKYNSNGTLTDGYRNSNTIDTKYMDGTNANAPLLDATPIIGYPYHYVIVEIPSFVGTLVL